MWFYYGVIYPLDPITKPRSDAPDKRPVYIPVLVIIQYKCQNTLWLTRAEKATVLCCNYSKELLPKLLLLQDTWVVEPALIRRKEVSKFVLRASLVANLNKSVTTTAVLLWWKWYFDLKLSVIAVSLAKKFQ